MATPKGPLRAYRKNKGMSLGEVAEKLGVASSTLRSWENGNRELPAEMAVTIERLFGIKRVMLRPDLFRPAQ